MEHNMTSFSERNVQRREARRNAYEGYGALKEARRMRKLRNGAFGNSAAHIYNMMVPGTTSVPRNDKGDDPGFFTVVKA